MSKDKGKDKDGGKYEGAFEEAALPKMKGGRRGGVPASLANLKPWRPGQSGNPLGQPRSVVELSKFVREEMLPVYRELLRLFFDAETPARDKVAIAALLDARACGRPPIGVFHGVTGGPGGGLPPGFLPVGDDGAPSALLLRADHESRDKNYKAQLQAELHKLEQEEAKEERARDEHLAAAKAAIARGEGDSVPGLTRMLIDAKGTHNGKIKRH